MQVHGMNKFHFMVSLTIALTGCKPQGGQDAAAPDESTGVAPEGTSQGPGSQGTQIRSLQFDGEQYSLQRAYVRGAQTINEYYRAGESAAAWRLVLTVSDSRGALDLKAFVKTYTDSLKAGLAVDKDIYEYGQDTQIVYSYQAAADRTEIAMLRAQLIPNLGIRSYLFIVKVPAAEKANTPQYTAKRDQWLNQITTLAVVPVPSM